MDHDNKRTTKRIIVQKQKQYIIQNENRVRSSSPQQSTRKCTSTSTMYNTSTVLLFGTVLYLYHQSKLKVAPILCTKFVGRKDFGQTINWNWQDKLERIWWRWSFSDHTKERFSILRERRAWNQEIFVRPEWDELCHSIWIITANVCRVYWYLLLLDSTSLPS